jgi:hypothetical protein
MRWSRLSPQAKMAFIKASSEAVNMQNSTEDFAAFTDCALQDQMTWLANGLQKAIPDVLAESDAFDCAIYHLSDKLWIMPAFEEFTRPWLDHVFRQGQRHQVANGRERDRGKAQQHLHS